MQLALIVFHQFLSVLFTIMYLVRFWDFSKDFFLFLMKCTKIFRVIYPSMRIDINLNYHYICHINFALSLGSLVLFRASKFRITGWKCSFKFATQEECSILFPFSSSCGIFDVMVSAYSERATSGLVSHSHVNGCSLFRILEGSGASLASPYGITKLRTHCCHHFTPWGLVGDFAGDG